MVLFDRSRLSLLQLKLMNVILWHFYQCDPNALEYEIKLEDMRRLLKYRGGLNRFVFTHLDKIAEQKIRWGYESKKGDYCGFSLFLGSVRHEEGTITYEIPHATKQMILNREVYDIVSVGMTSMFKSKYAVNLYEVCHKYRGTTRGTTGTLTLTALRELLGVPDDEYYQSDFNRVKKKIIEPAVAEVNELSDITVTSRYVHSEGRGRKVIGVAFGVKEKPVAVMPHKMPDLRKGPSPKGVGKKEIKQTELDDLRAKEIIEAINLLDPKKQEDLKEVVYENYVKGRSGFIQNRWRESGIESILIKTQMTFFEEYLDKQH